MYLSVCRQYTDAGLSTRRHRVSLLPAMGYGDQQVKDLEKTIANTPCDAVVIGTPIDLGRIIKIKQPTVKVGYELQEIGTPNLEGVLKDFCKKHKLKIKK